MRKESLERVVSQLPKTEGLLISLLKMTSSQLSDFATEHQIDSDDLADFVTGIRNGTIVPAAD